jgi:hypothetical protein
MNKKCKALGITAGIFSGIVLSGFVIKWLGLVTSAVTGGMLTVLVAGVLTIIYCMVLMVLD